MVVVITFSVKNASLQLIVVTLPRCAFRLMLGQHQWNEASQNEDDQNKAKESSWRAKPSSHDENSNRDT